MSASPPPQDESIFAHVIRVCKNSCTKCFGVVQTTDEYAKIKYKEYQIESRKKQFGMDFYKLVIDNASDADKQACIDKVLADTATIEKEIDVLQAEIERVNKATNEKIIAKPGSAPAATTTTTTTNSTPANTTPVTEAPAVTPAAVPTPTPEPASTGVEIAAEDVNMQEIPLTSDAK